MRAFSPCLLALLALSSGIGACSASDAAVTNDAGANESDASYTLDGSPIVSGDAGDTSIADDLVLPIGPEQEAIKTPIVGIQYWTWFAYDKPAPHCDGAGWKDNPFGQAGTASLVFNVDPKGVCYSSIDPNTARVHAGFLRQLKADFVIYDETNFSKTTAPANNPMFQAEKAAIEGFSTATEKMKSVFMLAITCWGEQCLNRPGDHTERFTFTEHVKEHVIEIAKLYKKSPEAFLRVEKKPLLLFYVNQGSNVLADNGQPAFKGAANLVPLPDQFEPVRYNGVDYKIHDLFTIRYAIVADASFDYSPYSKEIWPFQCNSESCGFAETGYASLYAPKIGGRSLARMNAQIDASKAKPYLVLRSWNEFSSTDEHAAGGGAYTLEPNTTLQKFDTTPGNMDPWYMFNSLKAKMATVK